MAHHSKIFIRSTQLKCSERIKRLTVQFATEWWVYKVCAHFECCILPFKLSLITIKC